MICIACPGQGSQAPGFLNPWLEIPVFKEQIEKASAVLGIDLVHYGTVADADAIRDTKIAQPLIVAAGIASYLTLKSSLGEDLWFLLPRDTPLGKSQQHTFLEFSMLTTR